MRTNPRSRLPQRRGGSRRRGRGPSLRAESLEPRLALCAPHIVSDFIDPAWLPSGLGGGTLTAGGQTWDAADSFAVSLASSSGTLATLDSGVTATAAAANGLPNLHSLPAAPTAIYLDFDGEGSNTPYDVDGDPTTFNATEQATITEAWRQVSVYFSMFDVDVTTVKPTVPFAWHVSSPSISGGYSSVGVFPNTSPKSFNQASDARTRVSGIVHELGHNFGLSHQSDYDLLGNNIKEYSSGFDSLHGPLMGVDYAQSVHKWFIGHPSGSASSLQDDIAVIAGKIKARQPAGGDGFRADDHGGTIVAARALTAAADGSRSISGIIERMADIDVFSFTTTGAGTAVVSVVPTKPSGLDAKLEVYDGTGVLVAASDGAANEQQVVLPVGAGTWYVSISSHGDYGDVGSYDLTVNDLPEGWVSADVGSVGRPGDASYDAATGTFTVLGSGADVFGNADAFRFAYQTLTGNGSIVARVTQNQNTNAWSKVGVEIRESLAANSKHVAMVTSATSGPQLVYRTSTGGTSTGVNGTAAAFAPTWVKLVRSGSTITASRSADGVSWIAVGSATVSMAAKVYIGLLTTSHDISKVNDAKFTNVALTGTINEAEVASPLPAPAGVAAARGTGTALTVSWQAVADATGYVIERSDDGVEFVGAGTATAAATTWTDSGLAGSMRYFYRVRSSDAVGRSEASSIVSLINRPSAVTHAAVTSLTASQVVLNWRDKSGDSGYRIERSSDNVTFSQVATVGTNVPSYTSTGLLVGTQYWFRITPMSPYGDSVSTTITGSTRLPAIGGLAFTSKTSAALAIQWTALSSATGYRVERSTDGTTFTTLANVANSVTTYSDTTVVPLGEYYYRVVATNAMSEGSNPIAIFAAAPAASALPAPWTSADIGSVVGSGAAGLSAGTFTIVSNGADIWGTADIFRYTSQPLVGDGSIVARVASIENTGGWAKIGVMLRESSAANSKHAMVVVTPSNGVAMQHRSTTGGASTNISGTAGVVAPYWVKLIRVGNVLTGSSSADGVAWTQVGSVTISMASSVLVGLSAGSNAATLLNKATFTNVTVSNVAPTVATAAAASPTTVTATTATVSVAGADDHAESNLVYAWSATGPMAVTFSASGTNAAKSSVATFTKAGTYTLTATITDTGGRTATSAVVVKVAQTATTMSVSPGTATVAIGATQQFTASVSDQFGAPLATQPAFTWSLSGGGTVSATGLFTAPTSTASATLTATAGSLSAAASVVAIAEYAVSVPAGQSVVDTGGRTGPLALRKRGAGTLVLDGPNAITGGLIVEEGTVVIRNVSATGGGGIDVQSAGRLRLDVGMGAVSATTLALMAGGLIDLGTGRIDVAAGGIGEYQLRQMLLAGRSGGSWAGTTGILSASAASSGGFRTVGYRAGAEGTTIAYAAPGDINLDGVIDVADMAGMLADGDYNGGVATWAYGDFNYDGVFDLLDISEFIMSDLFNTGSYLS